MWTMASTRNATYNKAQNAKHCLRPVSDGIILPETTHLFAFMCKHISRGQGSAACSLRCATLRNVNMSIYKHSSLLIAEQSPNI